MSEMTVAEAVLCLNNLYPVKDDDDDYGEVIGFLIDKAESDKIAALLTSQQAEIESLKCCGNCKEFVFVCRHTKRSALPWSKCSKWERMV